MQATHLRSGHQMSCKVPCTYKHHLLLAWYKACLLKGNIRVIRVFNLGNQTAITLIMPNVQVVSGVGNYNGI